MTFLKTNPWLIPNVLSSILGLLLLYFWLFIFLQFRAFEGDSGNYSSRTQLLKIASIFAITGGIMIGLIITGLQVVLILDYIDSIIKLALINISIFVVLLFILYCLIIFKLKTEE
ncbi:hypothetical protein [Crocosphaera chwakensis]|uniref:Uncharacterized protein n=1 Tax=Crocosphaera chwakensis CCY0110 TaxID=391612 RepID=A3IK07_9CHRO|nr:hypothetical protein [Crocosphaera chwakensis]EAZ92996.1 hypothetical protein CY0110_02969 [Crocosphaera chwakensis CCY0110]